MKEQKIIFYVSIVIAAGTLLLSIAGERNWIDPSNPIFSGHRDYFINFNMGIFAGAGLAAATSYITYSSLKRKSGINYWLSLESFIQKTEVWAFNQFENVLSASQGVENVKNLILLFQKYSILSLRMYSLFKRKVSWISLIINLRWLRQYMLRIKQLKSFISRRNM